MLAILGVHANKWTIVKIEVSFTSAYGGQNLTPQQKIAQSCSVPFHIRLRNDVALASIRR
ncbi:hypothetical protein [Massilia sp. CCM 8734]|uniref:hypothetical protein n=1 Tax=Massilia sp. CCM 8734 TaxID=2609283 RepID=UPI0014248AC5|nr:hypothetical protein [Massilia sp. CCM 8734]NHZ94286.1 hypothetical protein [Massilia sp. CCM 8734]